MNSLIRKVLKSKLFLFFCLIILVFLIISFGKEFTRRYYLEKEVEKLEEQIAELENRNQKFTELVDYLNTEDFTEAEARLKMGLKKPGEEVMVIEYPEGQEKEMVSENNNSDLTNPDKWWHYFFKIN